MAREFSRIADLPCSNHTVLDGVQRACCAMSPLSLSARSPRLSSRLLRWLRSARRSRWRAPSNERSSQTLASVPRLRGLMPRAAACDRPAHDQIRNFLRKLRTSTGKAIFAASVAQRRPSHFRKRSNSAAGAALAFVLLTANFMALNLTRSCAVSIWRATYRPPISTRSRPKT